MTAPVTAFHAALNALWILPLALRVGWLRQRENMGFGAGNRTAPALGEPLWLA